MRPMGVAIREWKGAWWIFINYHGTRKAKRIGTGEVGRRPRNRQLNKFKPGWRWGKRRSTGHRPA